MSLLRKIWHWVRWPLAVLVVFYIALVLYRIPAVSEQQHTQEVVAKIRAQKITFSDVMGNVLPPTPNKEENDATVEGIDKNNNGIRDDVELAIFALHPTSAKIRAAELQYAMTEQMFLTEVFNTETWKAVAVQDDRAYRCISDVYPKTNTTQPRDVKKYIEVTDGWISEIKKLVLNTQLRKDTEYKASLFTTSYGSSGENSCDIDLNTLPN
jgi:hypothetical protein